MTPIAATTTCMTISSQSMPRVSATPNSPAIHVPMNAATMPTTTVSQIGMSCLPGATRRPRNPMMAPMMIAVMMPVTVIAPPGSPMRAAPDDPLLAVFPIGPVLMQELQADDARDDGPEAEQPQHGDRLAEHRHPVQD